MYRVVSHLAEMTEIGWHTVRFCAACGSIRALSPDLTGGVTNTWHVLQALICPEKSASRLV